MKLLNSIQNNAVFASILPVLTEKTATGSAICARYLCDNAYKITSPSVWRIWQTQITPNHSLVKTIFSCIVPNVCAAPFILIGYKVVHDVRTLVNDTWLSKIVTPMSMGCIALAGKTLFDKIESPVGKLAILSFCASIGNFYGDEALLKNANFWEKHPFIRIGTYAGLGLYLRKVCFEKGVHPVYTVLFGSAVVALPVHHTLENGENI